MADQGKKLWEGELYRLLVENVQDFSIFVISPDGEVLTWGHGCPRLMGWTESEIVGQNWRVVFTPEDCQKGAPEQEMRKAAEAGRAEDERWHVRKDGTRFRASGVLTPLYSDDGKLHGYAKIMRDVTARWEAGEQLRASEAALAAANAQKDRFLAVLSHELRNPLAPMRNVVGVLSQRGRDDPLLGPATAMLERQLGVMTRLIDELLDAARIVSGKLDLRKELIEAGVVVGRAVEAARPEIDARQHHLTVSVPDVPVWLEADPVRLEQVVLNLLTNAAKYTDDGGRIRLAVETEAGRVAIRVTDSGIGIAPDELPHVFGMFTQLDTALHRKQSGLGIGLALVKSLVELHGGTVEAHSGGAGRGSEFVVRLPMPVNGPAQERPTTPPGGPTGQPLVVLVVDDNADSADSLAMLLRAGGHEVRAEHSGLAALKAVESFRPDVVLCDVGMPVMDGLEVAARLRQRPDMANTVLIALTGYGHQTDVQKTKDAGYNYHLVKPVDPGQLQQLLAVLAADRREHGPG